MVDRRELAERIGRVLHILSRPPGDDASTAAPALQWAQGGAQKVGEAVQALPSLPRKMMDRIRPGSTDGEDAGDTPA